MSTLVNAVRRFLQEEEGANGVEYALLAGLIAVAFVAGAGALGTNLNAFLQGISRCVATPTVANCTAPGFGG